MTALLSCGLASELQATHAIPLLTTLLTRLAGIPLAALDSWRICLELQPSLQPEDLGMAHLSHYRKLVSKAAKLTEAGVIQKPAWLDAVKE